MTTKHLKHTLLASFLTIALTGIVHGKVQWVDQIVAQAGNEVVTQVELEQVIAQATQQLQAKGRPVPAAELLREDLLEQLILKKLQLQRAKDQGIVIDDITLDRAIKGIADENNMSLNAFIQEMNRQGLPYQQFREEIRQELAITRLRKREIGSRVNVSEQEIDDIVAKHEKTASKHTAYRLSHILITSPDNANAVSISKTREKAEAIRQQALQGEDFSALAKKFSAAGNAPKGGDLGWRKREDLPTLFEAPIRDVEKGGIAPLVESGNNFHIVKVSDLKSGAQSATETQYRARHILIQRESDPRAVLTALKSRAMSGEDFGELAKKYSKDPGSAIKGGDLGWAPASTYVPAFANSIANTLVGDISPPFKSQFGWHILQVQEKRSVDVGNEKLRQRAKNLLTREKEEEAFKEWLRELRDEAFVKVHKVL